MVNNEWLIIVHGAFISGILPRPSKASCRCSDMEWYWRPPHKVIFYIFKTNIHSISVCLFVLNCVEKCVRPTFVCVCFLRLLRASVLGLACKLGDKEALDSASQLFQQWLTGTVRWLFTVFSFPEDFKLWNKTLEFLKHCLFS